MELIPSFKLSYSDELKVLSCILGTGRAVIVDAMSARNFIFKTQYQLSDTDDEETEFPDLESQILQNMLQKH